jgi:uncharacterized protein (DUF1800 family)
MDRRDFISGIIGEVSKPSTKADGARVQVTLSGKQVNNYSLAPYSGQWGVQQASHLLRRTMFGVNGQDLKYVLGAGLNASLNTLLRTIPISGLPLVASTANEVIPVGQTWVGQPNYGPATGIRIASFQAWWTQQMLQQPISIHQKLILFWHNHFVVESAVVRDPRMLFKYYELLHANALGNFKTLAEKITVDAAMLTYLDGNTNINTSPNENYARELFELFTIGKGAQIAEGHYTNFTEQDVLAAARLLTGWRINQADLEVRFIPNFHDTGSKEFSEAFGNRVIQNANEEEYKLLIDMIFEKKETARNICRKLYRWFVYYDISNEVEDAIIEPLADLLIANNFEVKPVLAALLSSQHFFDEGIIGAIIKNPHDYLLGMIRSVAISLPDGSNVPLQYAILNYLRISNAAMQMEISNPPQVAGWAAYFQSPSYYRSWINSATVPLRKEFSDGFNSNLGIRRNNFTMQSNPFSLLAVVDDPFLVQNVVRDISNFLLPQPLSAGKLDYLKETLIPGLPDYEWTNQYAQYDANPADTMIRNGIAQKLRSFIQNLMALPEYQLG